LLSQWKPEDETASFAQCACGFDAAMMGFHNPFDQGESKACIAAARIAGWIGAVETLPDSLKILLCNADTVVADLAYGKVPLRKNRKLYKASASSVLNGI